MNISASLQDFNLLTGVLLTVAYVVIDGLYAYYTIQVSKRHPVRAATTSGIMHFLLALGVLNYVQNFFYVIPLAIGSWIGTYLIVRRQKIKEATAAREQFES